MSLDRYSEEEHKKFLDAESKYGNAFVNAYNTTIMLSNILLWPINDCDLFIRFYSQMKKYHTLSMLSTVRLHRIQAKLDLRYFLESTVNAAFTLAHTDTKNYLDSNNKKVKDAQKATSNAYKWIEGAYSGYSTYIKELKADINNQTAHAHVANSEHNFDFIPGPQAAIVTSYFDFDDDQLVKGDLWVCAKAGLTAIDLMLAVQKNHGGILPSRAVDGLGELKADNDAVSKELNP